MELRKSVLEADDSGLVKRLLVDPNVKAADAAEEQAIELGIMRIGFPAQVKPTDDHPTHVRTMLDYLALKSSQNADTDPVELQRIQEHLGQHMAMFQEQDGKAAKQLAMEVAELSNAVNQQNQAGVAPQQDAAQIEQPNMDQAGGGAVASVPQQPAGPEN